MGCWSKRPRRNFLEKSIEVELKIRMHCENCAKDVKKASSKVEGVEACRIDMDNQKVMVTGNFNLEKLLKTLKKKTGKKAEILMMNEKADMVQKENDDHEVVQNEDDDHDVVQKENDKQKTFTEKKEEGDIVQQNDENPEVEEKINTSETSTTKVEIIVEKDEEIEMDRGVYMYPNSDDEKKDGQIYDV